MEKIISEFKVSETEDGFRVDIKGNEEALRQMLNWFGACDSFKAGAPASRSFCFDPDPSFLRAGFWSKFGSWCGAWGNAKEKSQRA